MLIPFFQQLVSKHPTNVWHRVTSDQAGQQHACAHRLAHRHRLHQELQLTLFSSFWN